MHLFIGEIHEGQALIDRDEAHHMQRVLRLNIGENVLVTNGKGEIYIGTISHISSKNAVITDLIPKIYNQKRDYKIELAVAPTKQIDRIEFFLEKAIEIGLDAYHPVVSFHSERRKINIERLERIALAAMKQSLKAEKTQITSLISFNEYIKNSHNFAGQRFIAHCNDDLDLQPIREKINPNGSYQFLIGPEGDFTQDEIELATANGFMPVSLGPQRMRTETAALYCVMIASYLHLPSYL